MRRTLELDGSDWEIQGFLGLDAGLRAAARPHRDGGPGWLPASVPGSVLDDLWRAGEVPDPYVERNSLAAEWVPQRTWVYRREIDVPPPDRAGRARLRFDGLDHAGHVFLDGSPVGSHAGMFVPFELDVTDRVASGGRHLMAVVVEAAPDSEPQVGRTSRVRVHKSRMGYGWDFCPRLVHQGLWQSVRLDLVGAVSIRDVWASPILSADLRRASVRVRVRVDAAGAARVRVEVSLDGPTAGMGGTTVDLPAGECEVLVELDVREPVLWWPNGAGDPVVHRLSVRVCDDEGVVDERSVPLGFRRVELVANAGAPDGARPWTWIVNGRRVYARGWNWVPVDALYGVPRPERLAHLMRLAANANVNLLRVWGGGLIETEAFYDACDAGGVMVWQEFAQSSSLVESTPATDAGFVDRMTREAEVIVPLRRNHPSLVAWCGGNELEGPNGPLDDDAPVLGALRSVVERLHPDRIWLPTSPSGPRFHNRLDVIEADPEGLHDVHGPWEHQGLRAQHHLYDRGTSLFNSEFGAEGMTNRRTHEALIRPERRWPPTRANPVYRHLGDWWINEPVVQAAFGGRLPDLESLRRASQWLQAEGLRYAVEANRRRAFRQGGSIPWQFNESYPNAWCTAAIDHRGDPKPAYHAVARAYGAVVVCASFDGAAWGGRGPFEALLWAWTDGPPVTGARIVARVLSVDGDLLAESAGAAEVLSDEAVRLGSIDGPDRALPRLFILELALSDGEGELRAANRYLLSGTEDFGALLDLAPATVIVDLDAHRLGLRHTGGPAALGIVVEDARPADAPGWLELRDNGFELLPGERRDVVVTWSDAPAGGRALRVSGWNVEPVELRAGA